MLLGTTAMAMFGLARGVPLFALSKVDARNRLKISHWQSVVRMINGLILAFSGTMIIASKVAMS